MFRRTRYQQGSLQRAKRSGGPDAWIFRWYEDQPNGGKRYRKTVVGTVVQFPTETAARKAADALRIDINLQTPQASSGPTTVDQLIEHFRLKEMPRDDHERRSYSTKAAYECYLTNWISPKWGKHRIGEIKAVAVENWLGTIPRADGTKAKIRNIMSAVFNHAVRHEWLDKNPITLVRQSAKRESIPEILNVEEIRALLAELELRDRTLVLLDAGTGLRVGELLGLKWQDVDFENLELHVRRSVVHQVIGRCKTEASAKPVPVDSFMAHDLLSWQRETPYNRTEDWVFASVTMKGTQPYWPENLMRRYVWPAAKRAKITKRIGWHTFRHTYSTLLRANGEDVKVVQELLRHANSKTTMDTYTQALSPAKRTAQSRVVRMFVGKKREDLA
jgi:integrase